MHLFSPYDANFIQGLLKKNEKKLSRSFNIAFQYIDDVLSLNNSSFGDFVDRIYKRNQKCRYVCLAYISESILRDG